MSQSEQPPHPLDDLPLLRRIPAVILNYMLDILEARHERSWAQGRDSVMSEGVEAQTPYKKGEELVAPVRLIVNYREGVEHVVPGKDRLVFNVQRFAVSAQNKASMRGDCASFLPANRQPTAEQWKAICSGSHSTILSGAAGTGKSTSLLLRVVFLHRYLGVDLGEISVLTVGRESRMEMAAELVTLFSKWGVVISTEQAQKIVKTPRSAVLEMAHSLPDLAQCIPFEVLNEGTSEAIADGRPFDARLLALQSSEMKACFQDLYRANKRFAELVIALYGQSTLVERLEVDNPEVIKRAPMGWNISQSDDELCDCIEGLWRNAHKWPLEGITPTRKKFTLRGRTYSSNGFIPQLNAHVVLGFDRSESRYLTRNTSVKTEAYKEVAVKRTLFQAYFPDRLVHLDSYQEATQLVQTLKSLPKLAPEFTYQLKGMYRSAPILELFNEVADLVDNLGLEVATVAGQMNFMPGDLDAKFFEALGLFWQAFERQLLARQKPCLTYGRLFDLFSDKHAENLRHIPMSALRRFRHVLIDNAEDHGVPIGGWLKGVLSELRRRDQNRDSSDQQCCTLFVGGDSSQWIYGTKGTSTQLLADVEEGFPAPTSPLRVHLVDCFRSSQGIVDAGHNVIQSLAGVSGRLTVSTQRSKEPGIGVEMWGDDPSTFQRLCKEHYDSGKSILILTDTPENIAWVDSACGDLVRKDRTAGHRQIRVRSFHKAKALEANVVFLVGDPSGGQSSWFRNQLYKIAGFSIGGDLTPGDTVLENEARRLVYVALTRANLNCYWFPMTGSHSTRTASTLITLSPGLFKENRL